MSDATQASGSTPWHLWAVGVVGALWNGFGCYDYVMTQTGGAEYLRASFTEVQVDYYMASPVWATALWAIGVWGGLLGAVLLLLRSKWALHALVASLAAFLLSLVYTYALTNGGEILGTQGMIMSAIIAAGCVFFAWYAWTMSKAGVLR